MAAIVYNRSLRVSRVLYSGLLILYPRDLRRRFGAEMEEVFEESLCAAAERGSPSVAAVWSCALWELLTVALLQRLASETVMAGAISFLAASGLFLTFFSIFN
jgi:hypothetical protein